MYDGKDLWAARLRPHTAASPAGARVFCFLVVLSGFKLSASTSVETHTFMAAILFGPCLSNFFNFFVKVASPPVFTAENDQTDRFLRVRRAPSDWLFR